jgi:hypothetical protein
MTGQYPRLRHHTRRRASGKVVTYYAYDRRPEGLPDVPLGRDWDAALKRWDELHNRLPRIAGTLEEAFGAWERDVLPAYASAETKRGYTKSLRRLRKCFSEATWDGVTLQDLRGYLKERKAKTQANREIAVLSLIWNWARVEGLTDLQYPAAGLRGSRWKNPEKARTFRPDDELFAAVYEHADQVLKDCMDIASATGMRLTDARLVVMPRGDVLHLDASKTGKAIGFDMNLSQVLPGLLARRRGYRADHVMLLSTPTGRKVSYGMLRSRWDAARAAAAEAASKADNAALAERIKAMWLRDMRKLASRKAGTKEAAARLLQHSGTRLIEAHYPVDPDVVPPVR